MVRIFNTGVVLRTLLTLVVLVGFSQCQGNNDADTPDAQGKTDLDQSSAGEMTEVTDEELQKFADVNQQMQGGSQQMQVEMKEAIEEQGLEPNKYNEIAKKMQETKGKAPSVSDENKEKAKKASDSMKDIQKKHQQEQQKEVQKILKKKGLSMSRYQQIGSQLQKDKDLQKRYMEMIQKQMKSKGAGPGVGPGAGPGAGGGKSGTPMKKKSVKPE